MKEWSANKTEPLEFLAVCSDATVGRVDRRRLTELFAPVTTDSEKLVEALRKPVNPGMLRAVFCTYQSSPMLAEAVKSIPDFQFDVAFFDEAHRTTGIDKTEGGMFQTGLDDERIPCRKRLFMTATPRVFTESQKARIANRYYDGQSYSMDDEKMFGPVFYRISFAEAVDGKTVDGVPLRADEQPMLSDYQIHVVAVSRDFRWQSARSEGVGMEWENIPGYEPQGKKNTETGKREPALSLSDGVRLAGTWDALATPYSTKVDSDRPAGKTDEELGSPAGTALLYANKVPRSKEVAMVWAELASRQAAVDEDPSGYLKLEVNHVDGNTNAAERTVRINRLRTVADVPQPTGDQSPVCEVLTNVKVLTEGVDVPGLDAVVFLDPKTSEVDITQAVGRAMRTTDRKTEGHIVIPVVIDEGETDPEQRLAQSEFANVASVVRALRSHDDRVDYWVSDPAVCQLKGPIMVRVIGSDDTTRSTTWAMEQMQFQLTRQLASVIVDRVGDKKMWPRWGQRAAKVCADVRSRLKSALEDQICRQAFNELIDELNKVMGGRVECDQTQEMVAQHIVTIPVFDAMFHGKFAQINPISIRISQLLDVLKSRSIDFSGDLAPLQRAYDRIGEVFEAAEEVDKKTDVLREIYDGFFKEAMPDAVKQLGIVYTPVQIVDFMIRSATAICEKEFSTHISDSDVQIYDPFCGTGTFPTRLLATLDKSGKPIVPDGRLEDTWNNLYGSELVMLAYYLSALQTEETYRRRVNDREGQDPDYQPWKGLVLQDTFSSGRLGGGRGQQRKLIDAQDNNVARAARLDRTPVDIIFSNPPWIAGARIAGQVGRMRFPAIEARVKETYGKKRQGGKALGNLYVLAIRWATDQLDKEPVERGKMIGFVHPNSLSDGPSLAGVRETLREEFTDIYVVNLRGNAYKSGDEFRKEGDKIFGGGSRNGVQITFLVKNPSKNLVQPATLNYINVPEYMNLDQKWRWLEDIWDITNSRLEKIPVNPNHDWVNISDGTFEQLLPVCSTKDNKNTIIHSHALGLTTNLDTYVYSFNKDKLIEKVKRLIDAYDQTLDLVEDYGYDIERAVANANLGVVKWTGTLKGTLRKRRRIIFDESRIREVLYRPFTKLWLYEDDLILSSVKTIATMFPRGEKEEAISFSNGSGRGMSDTAFASDEILDLNSVRGGGQGFSRGGDPDSEPVGDVDFRGGGGESVAGSVLPGTGSAHKGDTASQVTGGGGRGFSSPVPPTRRSSESSLPGSSAISAQWGLSRLAGSSPGGDDVDGPVEHGPVRGVGGELVGGFAYDGGGSADAGDSSPVTGGGQASGRSWSIRRNSCPSRYSLPEYCATCASPGVRPGFCPGGGDPDCHFLQPGPPGCFGRRHTPRLACHRSRRSRFAPDPVLAGRRRLPLVFGVVGDRPFGGGDEQDGQVGGRRYFHGHAFPGFFGEKTACGPHYDRLRPGGLGGFHDGLRRIVGFHEHGVRAHPPLPQGGQHRSHPAVSQLFYVTFHLAGGVAFRIRSRGRFVAGEGLPSSSGQVHRQVAGGLDYAHHRHPVGAGQFSHKLRYRLRRQHPGGGNQNMHILNLGASGAPLPPKSGKTPARQSG